MRVDCAELTRFIVPGTDSDVAEAYAALAERARTTVFGFEDEVVFVDIETTGFDPDRDAIIEIAALRAKGPEMLDRFHTMVDPGRPVPLEITKLTGIDDAMLAGAPGPEAAATDFARFAGGADIIAHNVSFDRGFLTRAAGTACFRGEWIDSLQLSLLALPRLSSHRLHDLALAFGATIPTHRATEDAEALAFLWRVMLCALEGLPPGLVAHIAQLAPGAEWPLRGTLAHIAGGSKRVPTFDLKETRRHRVTADKAESLLDAEGLECSCPPAEEIVSEFEADGIAGRMYQGFERRDEQARMATAVTEAFASGTHAAIEAGTGVGKSVAYLVPAARFALENKVSVGVATKTNSLADQLIYSELPALCEAMDEPLRYVSLKGYEHYPCLRKLERFASELGADAPECTIVTTATLLTWSAQSSWGDLDAMNIHWSRELRTQIAAAIPDCTHKRCRFFPNLCYLHGARRRAASSHIVVTNHALLFRDVVASGGILPPIRHWIVDEAHAAEAEARDQLTLAAGHMELAAVLTALHSRGRGGILEAVRRKMRSAPGEPGTLLAELVAAEEAITTAATLVNSLFDFVKDLGTVVADTGYDQCDVRITSQIREAGPWGPVASIGGSLARKLEAVLERGRSLVTLLEQAGPEFGDPRADLAGLLSRIADQLEGLTAVLSGESAEYVYWLELDRRRNVATERLIAARLDVGQVLAEEFFSRSHSIIFTSATIAAGDDFSHFVRGVGLDRLDEGAYTTLRLESSYDFDNQMAVFVPNDMAMPSTNGYLSDLESLLRQVHLAMGGSTLTLFTNRRDMDRLYQVLEPELETQGVSLIIQGKGVSRKRLRDEFLADEALSLFATKSFWEGFDAKGDTLRCVVVPRLPFGRPTDPLAQEREEREGRAAWARYALPEAVIELKQAAGRLIRSKSDTGCLVIADSRVLHKGYGRDFLAALPVKDIERLSSADTASEIGRRFGRPKPD
ncbi:MAG: DNA polymerase III subunit epsilon [Actinobacteria bacterium HGW-Actinobacteria-10]|nr:MAG: DNA polymerase III subunit epsilon [Actinobacteria bacterium HGW-Actinobacteria-10]